MKQPLVFVLSERNQVLEVSISKMSKSIDSKENSPIAWRSNEWKNQRRLKIDC